MPKNDQQASRTRSPGRIDDAVVRVLPENAVVIVRDLDGDSLDALLAALKHLDRSDVLVVDLGEDVETSLRILDEDAMREYGWIRAG